MSEPLLKKVQALSPCGLHRVAYWEWGQADNPRVLVCVHGLSRQGRDFDVIARRLSDRFRVICPGWVLTPLVQKQIDDRSAKDKLDPAEAKRQLLAEKQPSLQFTTPEELGALTVFLCSDAAVNVRGQAWAMDGGWTAQ